MKHFNTAKNFLHQKVIKNWLCVHQNQPVKSAKTPAASRRKSIETIPRKVSSLIGSTSASAKDLDRLAQEQNKMLAQIPL